MKNSLMIAMVLVLGLTTSWRAHASAGEEADSVFMDEGDSDFEAVPEAKKTVTKKSHAEKPVAKVEAAAHPAPAALPEPAEDMAVEEAMPKAKVDTVKAEADDALSTAEPTTQATTQAKTQAKTQEKSAEVQPIVNAKDEEATDATDAPVATAKHVREAPVKAAKKVSSHKKKAAGLFVVTQGPCKMSREPASDSAELITVKPAKKIWVEEVDDTWVRGFDKQGTAGYINRDCVK